LSEEKNMKRNTFSNQELGISGVVPDGWVQAQPGLWLRHASETDLTHLVQQRVGGINCDDVMTIAVSQEGLEAFPEQVGMIESPNFTWSWYRSKVSGPVPRVVDLALAQHGNWIYVQEDLDRFLGLDGDDELVVYLAPVGKVESA
jgi:hypothetical protein